MADEQSQRPYRASEPPLRSHARTANNDPLAELARLIGQTDPFGEFGRDTARRSVAPAERSDRNTQATGSSYAPQSETDWRGTASQRSEVNGYYGARGAVGEQAVPVDYDGDQSYGRQSYGGVPDAAWDDVYQAGHEAHGYTAGQADYQDGAYEQDAAQHREDEYYDEAPSSRRRVGVMAIAGVFALALIGTAGAFGYRALFGSSSSPQPPPVIKADAGPSKIVPAASGKDAQSNKLITERVNEGGQSEKLVSREEQPIDKPASVVLSQAAPQSALGSGVVGSEPKKVRTIAIRPDQSADAAQAVAPLATATRAPQASTAPAKPAAVPRPAENATADADSESTPAPATRSAPSARQAAPSSSNTPLSLNPDASPARAQARPAPTQTAAVAPQASAPAATTSSGGSGSFVQVSSQRSEAEAQVAFRSLQAKYPTQLGSRELLIHRADLGAKGTYYRAMVGPFANPGEAADLCSSLKAAGGQCLVQRN